MAKTLIIGACGQIGTELVLELRKKWGNDQVTAADVKEECPSVLANGPYVQLDILNRSAVREFIIDQQIEHVYLLAALLSEGNSKDTANRLQFLDVRLLPRRPPYRKESRHA